MATRINHILDAPSAPVVDKWSANHVVLTWDEPLSDSGSPINGYIVEKMDNDSQMWEKTVMTYSPVPCATINGLITGNKYQFRIIAFNDGGQSEPSEVSKEFVAEHKFLTPKNVKRHLSDVTQPPRIKLEAALGDLTPVADWSIKKPRTSTLIDMESDSVPLDDNLHVKSEEIVNHPQAVEGVQLLEMSEETDETMEENTLDVMQWVVDSEATETKPPGVNTCDTPTDSSDIPDAYSEIDVSSSAAELIDSLHSPVEVGSESDSGSECEELDEANLDILTELFTVEAHAADNLVGTSSNFDWVSDFDSFKGIPEEFTGPTPGAIKDYDSPYDAFTNIWDQDIIDYIVLKTNLYAEQTIDTMHKEGTLCPRSRIHSWTDTNADEIMVLLSLIMYMAIDVRSSIADYWTTDNILQLPGFRNVMSYNRYILLLKFLHFVDNSAVASQHLSRCEDSDNMRRLARVAKLMPIIDHLGNKFKCLYNLEPNISIDESLTLLKGGLSCVQTTRSKADRFGIKSYELCESRTGYMAAFQIYTGKGDSDSDHSPNVNLGRKSTNVVLDLLQGLEHRGHCVVMDNYYNCPALARYLKSLGFDCLGILRSCCRNVPSEIARGKKVSKGTIISRHCGDVSIISWIERL